MTTGGCLCGAVRWSTEARLRPVVACHCTQCRRTSGHHVAATSAPRQALRIEGTPVWFRSSPGARRGFCRVCGANLFWDREGDETVSIFAGSIDGPSGLEIAAHIFTAFKGDYYVIADGAPQHAGWPEDRVPE